MSRPLQLARPAWILAAHLLLFSLARLVLYWTWQAEFADLSWAQLARGFLTGLIFDASVITIGLSPVILALCLPFSFTRQPRWRAAWSWLAFAHFGVTAAVLFGDVAYFGVVRRHVGPELVALVDDPQLMFSIVWDGYKVELFGLLVGLGCLFVVWARTMRWDERRPRLRAPAWSLE